MNKNLNLLTSKQRQIVINKIINYFATERDGCLGIMAAENLLDFFLGNVGNHLYNKGVKDAKKLVKDGTLALEFQIDLLTKDN